MVELVKWGLRIYNGLAALMYLCIAAVMIFFAVAGVTIPDNTSADVMAYLLFFGLGGVLFLGFLVFHGLLAVFAGKRSQLNYIAQVIAVALSFGSGLFLLPGILLLIGLLSEEVRQYYWKN